MRTNLKIIRFNSPNDADGFLNLPVVFGLLSLFNKKHRLLNFFFGFQKRKSKF